MRAALTATDHGIRPGDGRLTVGAFLDEWLELSVRDRCRPNTFDSYAFFVRKYLTPALGHVPIAKLGPEHVQRMLTDLTASGKLSPTTVRYVYSVLRIALSRALKAGKVVRNVATLVDPPRKARFELAPLSAEQVQAFLEDVAADRMGPLYVAAIGLGMRQGELLALRWQDVDLEAGTVSVRHTLQRDGRTLAAPKTERAKRTLRLGGEVLASLRAHRVRQLEERMAAGTRWHDEDFVFTTPLGSPLDSRNVTRAFQAALTRSGLPRQRFHDMRHACATLLLEGGEELGVVSKILGHATLGTTADVYAHLTPAMSQRVADRMDTVLRRRPASG
ncbi:MAG: site-specific integrase [Chloroflexi bacterium]|nr:site-specific integrase [Chloroflexota bacterium]